MKRSLIFLLGVMMMFGLFGCNTGGGGEDYVGEGRLADVALYFDDSVISVRINDRELLTVNYEADRNAYYEDRIVSTNGFFCRDGWIEKLSYDSGYDNDDILTATLVMDDGSTEEVRFHTGSEESLYLLEL